MDKWGLDPLCWSFVKVFIVQVHQLSLFEGTADTHMLYGRPISRVEVVGVVVSVKQHARFVKYYIDDGTGVIACMAWKQHADSVPRGESELPVFELGDTVCVQGKLNFQTRRYLDSGTACAVTPAGTSAHEDVSGARSSASAGAEADGGANGWVTAAAPPPQKRARMSALDQATAEPRYCLEREREIIVQRLRSLHALRDRGVEEHHWLSVMSLSRSVYQREAFGPLHEAPVAVPVAATPGARDHAPAAAGGGSGTASVGAIATDAMTAGAASAVAYTGVETEGDAALQAGLVGPCCRCAARNCRCCQRCREVQWDGSCYHRISLACDPSALFRDALVRHLVDMEGKVEGLGMLCFLFSEIRQAPALIHKANEVVLVRQRQRERAREVSTDPIMPVVPGGRGVPTVEAQVEQLFMASCAALRSANVVFLRCVERDEYALCSWPRVAEPALLQLFDHETRVDSNSARRNGHAGPVRATAAAIAAAEDSRTTDIGTLERKTEAWTEDQIVREIKSVPHLTHLQRADVHTLLQRMLHNSKVYETGSSGPTAYLRVPM